MSRMEVLRQFKSDEMNTGKGENLVCTVESAEAVALAVALLSVAHG